MKKAIILFVLFCFVSCEMEDIDGIGNLVPPTAEQDANLPSIKINGTVLHTETFGDIHNPIIIFLHGGPGGDYRALISEFGQENASRYPSERMLDKAGLTRLQDDYFLVFYDQSYVHFFSHEMHLCLLMISLMPIAANTVLLASLFQAEPAKAATAVSLSTLVALPYIFCLWPVVSNFY